MDIVKKNEKDNLMDASQIYHYEIWENSNFIDKNLHSITLKGCTLSNCTFIHTILADSDWDSCQVENCNFQNLSLENSDLTSTYFEHCNFSNVSFKGTTTTDITFQSCQFTNCDFNHISLSNSVFDRCEFFKLKLRQSSTSLNQFIDCQFVESKIGGNFLYNIFFNSHFERSEILYSLIASNFGFSLINLEELSWDKKEHKLLQQSFLDKKDVISAAIISLNLDESSYDYSIWACMQVIMEQLKNGILVRIEQFLFLKLIIDNLLNEKKFSLFTTVYLLNVLEKAKFIKDNIAIQKSKSALQQLNGLLLEYYHRMINQTHKEMHQLECEGKPITLKMVYEKEPTIPIAQLLEQLMKHMNIPGPYPVRIRTESGSFIEWIQGYDNILKCLQLLISVLGLKITLKKHNMNTSKLEKERQESDETNVSHEKPYTQSNSVVVQIPESVLNQISTVCTEEDVHKAINVFVINGVNINNNFQGYNNINFKNIEIL